MKLNNLIVRLGDPASTSLESNLEGLTGVLEKDLNRHQNLIIDILFNCVLLLPHKLAVYTTLAGLVNVRAPAFGQRVAERVGEELQAFLSHSHGPVHTQHLPPAQAALTLTRFACDLVTVNLLHPSSVLSLLQQYIEQSGSTENLDRAELFIGLVVRSLPWGGRVLSEHNPSDFEAHMANVDSYMASRRPALAMISPFTDSVPAEDDLSLWWAAVQELRSSGWRCKSLKNVSSTFESSLNVATSHPVSVALTHRTPPHASPVCPFRLFSEAQTELDLRPIDRLIATDYITGILTAFEANHKEGVKQLSNLPLAVPQPLILEVLFAELFHLPLPARREPFYMAFIADLCLNKDFPPVLAQGINLLFQRVEHMDAEVFTRFVTWFSHHLSNFDWKWEWRAWAPSLVTSEPKAGFVRETLEKMTRLSYFERIKRSLPEELYSYLPPTPTPRFRFRQNDAHDAENYAKVAAQTLMDKMQTKESDESVLDWLSTVRFGQENDSPEQLEKNKIDTVVQCMFQMGAKSLSHFLNTVERYLKVLQELTGGANRVRARLIVAGSIAEFWRDSSQHIVLLMDKLMAYNIIDNTCIVNWIFDQQTTRFTRNYIWEILHNTIQKTMARCEDLKEQLKTADDDALRAKLEVNIAKSEQDLQNLFLLIFRRFCEAIAEVGEHDRQAALLRLKEVGRRYFAQLQAFLAHIELEVLANAEPEVMAIFTQIKSLKKVQS